MKFDVIIAACVGVFGYIVEHRSARSAERRQNAIQRAGAQLNQLLVPLNLHFTSLTFAQHTFIDYCTRQPGFPDPPKAAQTAEVPRKSMQAASTVSKFSSHLSVALESAFANEPMSNLCSEYRLWVTKQWVLLSGKWQTSLSQAGICWKRFLRNDCAKYFLVVHQCRMATGHVGCRCPCG
jgi:hypothetical protein